MACPSCGEPPSYPFRARFHTHAALVAGAGALLIVFAVVGCDQKTPARSPSVFSALAWVALLVTACAFAAHVLAEFALFRSYRVVPYVARRAIASGRVVMQSPGSTPHPLPNRRRWVWVALGFLLVTPLVSLAPRAGLPGGEWPANAELHELGVVCPGSSATVSGKVPVRSIDGLYAYTGTVEHLNAAECGREFNVRFEPRSERWTDQIKTNSLRGSRVTADVLLKMQLPDDEALYGQTLRLRVTANITYPDWGEGETYIVRYESAVREITIGIPRRDTIVRFSRTARSAIVAAALLYLVGGVMLTLANVRPPREWVSIEVREEPLEAPESPEPAGS